MLVAPISLTFNPKVLWFDPNGLDITQDVSVVVKTARGTEFGRAMGELLEVSDAQIKALKSPLKKVLRIATEEDIEQAAAMEEKSREALAVFKEMAAESNKDMHPVSVEFLLDGDKAIFYFESVERVDFRDLVRRLAAHFHVRIDMHQIGVRDEASIIGGLGHCGQELCCKRLGGEFSPVSIRMAKEQDLSLNPQKISGLCGRLMCCLRYEFDAYKDFRSRAPKIGAKIDTPDGCALVTDLDIPREIITLKIGEEKPVKVPLSAFEEPEEGRTRPSKVTEEGWYDAQLESINPQDNSYLFVTAQFSGTDKLAERRTSQKNDSEQMFDTKTSTKEKHRRAQKDKSRSQNSDTLAEETSSRKPRKRRTTKITQEDVQTTPAPDRPRPGQHSSGLRNNSSARSHNKEAQSANDATPKSRPARRRRSHKLSSGSASADTAQEN